jgi:hypothetical protein
MRFVWISDEIVNISANSINHLVSVMGLKRVSREEETKFLHTISINYALMQAFER